MRIISVALVVEDRFGDTFASKAKGIRFTYQLIESEPDPVLGQAHTPSQPTLLALLNFFSSRYWSEVAMAESAQISRSNKGIASYNRLPAYMRATPTIRVVST